MKAVVSPGLVAVLMLSTIVGCDFASEAVPAIASIDHPVPDQTLYLGEAFRVRADIEAEAPVDSVVLHIQPKESGADALRFPLSVPSGLRSGPPNLLASIDTTLVVDALPAEGMEAHVLWVRTYVENGELGRSPGIPVLIDRRP